MEAVLIGLATGPLGTQVDPTFHTFQLMSIIAVGTCMDSVTLSLKSMSIGSASKCSMAKTGNCRPVSHKEIEGFSSIPPASNLLLNEGCRPFLSSLRPYPLWAIKSYPMKVSQFIPLAMTSKIPPKRHTVLAQRYQHPIAGPNEELEDEQRH